MKILYNTIVDYNNISPVGNRLDYQADSLFHGFRSLLGPDTIDFPKMKHMYKGPIFEEVKKDKCKGFTLYNRLEDIEVDRTDIEHKLRIGYFDLVVVPIHHSNLNNEQKILNRLSYLSQFLPNNKILVVDGNDESRYFDSILDYGVLFKRELIHPIKENLKPVSFSIPKEVIVSVLPLKSQDFATLIPSMHGDKHKSTYVFNDEESYFNDYKRSYFGFTCKKGGWDCLRHLEILACGCVPLFLDIEYCPHNTLFKLPKELLSQAKSITGTHIALNGVQGFIASQVLESHGHYIDHENFDLDRYLDILNQLLIHTRKHLTTEEMAKYMIGANSAL